jgi:hypothetical protein
VKEEDGREPFPIVFWTPFRSGSQDGNTIKLLLRVYILFSFLSFDFGSCLPVLALALVLELYTLPFALAFFVCLSLILGGPEVLKGVGGQAEALCVGSSSDCWRPSI